MIRLLFDFSIRKYEDALALSLCDTLGSLITYLMVRHNSPTHKKSKLNYKINKKIESFKKVELPPLLKGIRTRVHFTIYGE